MLHRLGVDVMLLPKLAAEEDPAELRRKVCPADFYFEFNFYCRRIFVLKKMQIMVIDNAALGYLQSGW